MMQTFSDANLDPKFIETLTRIGFTQPTPIQQQSIPLSLNGQDILGSAQTGTGKTGAFGIPVIAYLMNNPKHQALILLPTRELAMQVEKALKTFMYGESIKSVVLIGGDSMPKQISQLRTSPRLIIGTPGRINDHLERKTLSLKHTGFLVLDEMDRMLDMGFDVQLEAIAKFLPESRQTLMFTATMPKKMEALAQRYLKNPVRICVGDNQTPVDNIEQETVQVSESEKYQHYIKELEKRTGSIITFVKTKSSADRMATKLREKGHTVEALHGDLRQSKRSWVIDKFRRSKCRILIATDVAARGLDIPHIEHVINYDLPQAPEDYIHRIGRTARAGAKGFALNLLSPEDMRKWHMIQKLLNPEYKVPRAEPKEKAFKHKRPPVQARNKTKHFGAKPTGGKPAGAKPFSAKPGSGQRRRVHGA
ncbi:MAG: DEAD/DEAH box helicase [Alphaproteobacteria bacterium]|nr:DEAD/DEAH box helicase [Alphaproteobacteria bacterium]